MTGRHRSRLSQLYFSLLFKSPKPKHLLRNTTHRLHPSLVRPVPFWKQCQRRIWASLIFHHRKQWVQQLLDKAETGQEALLSSSIFFGLTEAEFLTSLGERPSLQQGCFWGPSFQETTCLPSIKSFAWVLVPKTFCVSSLTGCKSHPVWLADTEAG